MPTEDQFDHIDSEVRHLGSFLIADACDADKFTKGDALARRHLTVYTGHGGRQWLDVRTAA